MVQTCRPDSRKRVGRYSSYNLISPPIATSMARFLKKRQRAQSCLIDVTNDLPSIDLSDVCIDLSTSSFCNWHHDDAMYSGDDTVGTTNCAYY